jgi:DNA-binding SARP family transcriptional activator
MGLSLKLLGQFEIRDSSGTALSLPTRKTRALLGYLAINAERPQPRERLMALLWSDRGEKQARQSLNHALRAIRKRGKRGRRPY